MHAPKGVPTHVYMCKQPHLYHTHTLVKIFKIPSIVENILKLKYSWFKQNDEIILRGPNSKVLFLCLIFGGCFRISKLSYRKLTKQNYEKEEQ